MNRSQAWALLVDVSKQWLLDEGSDVVFAGEYEGRWAVRVGQQTRDFTTIWFEVGDLTVGYEAYVMPKPAGSQAEVFRQLLVRNHRLWRAHFSTDRFGDIFLRGRVALDELSAPVLDEVLGTVYDAIEVSFRSLVKTGFGPPTA